MDCSRETDQSITIIENFAGISLDRVWEDSGVRVEDKVQRKLNLRLK